MNDFALNCTKRDIMTILVRLYIMYIKEGDYIVSAANTT